MKTAAILLAALSFQASAGIVAISNTTGRTVVLTSEECPGMPGWGRARLADGYKTAAWGCWQLGDNSFVVARFVPEWKDISYHMGTFQWLPNVQFTRTK